MSDRNIVNIRHYLVRGLVQGVCYRANTMDMGRSLKLSGWVRNLPDGSVEAMAAGDNEALQDFTDWLHKGPTAARVESVEVTAVKADSASEALPHPFEIRR